MKNLAAAPHNSRKSNLILLLLVIFSTTIGFLVGKLFDVGTTGGIAGGIIGIAYGIIVFFFSERIILSSLAAKPIQKETNTHLYKRVQELAKTMQIHPPLLYYIDDSAMNILALGRSPESGKIIITKGLIEKLTTSEIEAVLAHELAHIKARDTLVGAYAVTTVGIFPFAAESFRRAGLLFFPFTFVLSLFSPLSGFLMQTVVSPKREFGADAEGVLLTRYPIGLAQALEKITQDPYSVQTARQATAHLFIVNPFYGKANRTASTLFMTHPPVQERTKILYEM